VAARAFAFAKEKFLTSLRVSRKRRRKWIAFECPQISNERTENGLTEMTEGRHSLSWNAVLENLKKFGVGELADLSARNNIRSAFSAFSIQAMAARAVGGKGLLGCYCSRCGFCPGIGISPALTEGYCSADQKQSERNEQSSRKNAPVLNDRSTF
jgi:hypothetical protein